MADITFLQTRIDFSMWRLVSLGTSTMIIDENHRQIRPLEIQLHIHKQSHHNNCIDGVNQERKTGLYFQIGLSKCHEFHYDKSDQ